MVACWMVLLFVVSAQNTEESSSVSGSVIEVVASVIRPSFSELMLPKRQLMLACCRTVCGCLRTILLTRAGHFSIAGYADVFYVCASICYGLLPSVLSML